MRFATLVLILSACGLTLSGCAAKYQEPASGERARLRVVNTGPREHTNVFIYPNVPASATCLAPGEIGDRVSIALLDWDNGLHKHKQGVSIGIPGNEAEKSERFAEIFIPAGQSFTLNVGGGGRQLGSVQGYAIVGGCAATASWVPKAGMDYEAVFDWNSCRLQVSTITAPASDSPVIRRPANVKHLDLCRSAQAAAK